MKKLLTAIAALMIVTFTGCTKNPCDGVSCLNNGVCATGTCMCTFPYEGSNCGTAVRDKYISKTYQGNARTTINSATTNTAGAQSVAKNGTAATDIYIGNIKATIVTEVLGSASITIPAQTVTDGSLSYTIVSGSGTLSESNVNYSFYFTTSGLSGTTEYTGTR